MNFYNYALGKLSISDRKMSFEELMQKIDSLVTEYIIEYDESIPHPQDIPGLAKRIFDDIHSQ